MVDDFRIMGGKNSVLFSSVVFFFLQRFFLVVSLPSCSCMYERLLTGL